MSDWASAYAPAIGAHLEGMSFQSVTADTPDVLTNLNEPYFWFSGSVCIGFRNGHQILLTWHSNRLCLTLGQESDWRPFSLDRINMSWEEPWGALGRLPLGSVHLYEAQIELGDRIFVRDIVAARHDFVGPEATLSLWICTGYPPDGRAGEGDDLYVGLEPPPNASELTHSVSFGP